jgi:hypothetical protein
VVKRKASFSVGRLVAPIGSPHRRHEACEGRASEDFMARLELALASIFAGVVVQAPAFAGPMFGDDPPRDAAAAERTERSEIWRPGFGARVGGYGFQSHDGSNDWNDCRMNGFGVFGTLDANRWLFGEAALDFYAADPEHLEHGMDRVSTIPSLAAGLRMFPEFVLTPYVQIGAGAEWTRVDLAGAQSERLYPMGFIGIGTELNVLRELKLGANLRMLAAAQAEPSAHGGAHAVPVEQPAGDQAGSGVPMRLGLAAQGQIFARYAL